MKKEKGITLIALVITIIVMLILVAVTINMAVNGGLFGYAGRAVNDTETKKEAEKDYTTLRENMSTDDLIEKYTTYGITYTAYEVGDPVTVGEQSFYVIEDSDETKNTVKLLAVNCVDTRAEVNSVANANYNKQTGFTYAVAFDSIGPFSNVYADSTIKQLVDSYVASLGVTVIEGRLMLKDEAEVLQTGHTDILYAKDFWLGSPDGSESASNAWYVSGSREPLVRIRCQQ